MAIKASPIVGSGMGFDHVGATRAHAEQRMWIKAFDKYASTASELMGVTNCTSSTSPKLDKQHLDGDDDDLKVPGVYRSKVFMLLHLAPRRPDELVTQALDEAERAEWPVAEEAASLLGGREGPCDLLPSCTRTHGDRGPC